MSGLVDWKFTYTDFPPDKPQIDTYLVLPYIFEFTMLINAKKVLEIGIGSHGLSTWCFLKALERTGGHLTSVDVKKCDTYYKNPRWRCIQGNSHIVDVSDTYDAVMIDSSHESADTAVELYRFVPMIRKYGILFMHDTQMDGVNIPLYKYIHDYNNLKVILKTKEYPPLTVLRKL